MAYIYGEVLPRIVEHGQLIRRELDRLGWPDAVIGEVRIHKSNKATQSIALFGVTLPGWNIPSVHVGSDGGVYTEQAVEGVADPGYDSGGYLLYERCPISDDRELHTYGSLGCKPNVFNCKDAPHILEKLEETLRELLFR